MEALPTATRYPVQYFDQQDTFGTIEVGKVTDLVLLEANRLGDIANTRKIAAMVVAGKLFSHSRPLKRSMLLPLVQPNRSRGLRDEVCPGTD